jgi:hypothetical protein
MFSSKPASSFRVGDRVIFSLHRQDARPGRGAKTVRPEPNGEGYLYLVDNLWLVAETRGAHVVVQTGRGRIHRLNATDARLHLAPWWQRLIFRNRWPREQRDRSCIKPF